MSQTAEDLSWPVQEWDAPINTEPLGKAMVEQGFSSDRATWSDVAEEEQRERDKDSWLEEEHPQSFVQKMPARSAARRSSVSATCMTQAILSECASCREKGFYSAQVRVHIVDGQELYQCEPCCMTEERGGKQMSATVWRNSRRQIKTFCTLCRQECNAPARKWRSRYSCHAQALLHRPPNGKGFTLSNWIKAVQEGKTVPKSAEVLQMLKDMNEKRTKDQLAILEAGLDWVPMILGDGQVVGPVVQKYYCESCKAMPRTDGQWFLFRKSNGSQVWICAVCGSIFSASDSPLCVGMKTGP
eukprot:9725862-Karenia_brevis.AAC.2